MCIRDRDIAGLVGVFLGGALYRIPVIVDGVISAVAALIAVSVFPAARDFIIASHQGKEPAMKALLKALEKEAVLFAELALGEGTGAVMLFPPVSDTHQICIRDRLTAQFIPFIRSAK